MDGIDDYVDFGSSGFLNGLDIFSASVWLKKDSLGYQVPFSLCTYTNSGWDWMVAGEAWRFEAYFDGGQSGLN